jgi:carbamoyltransferase
MTDVLGLNAFHGDAAAVLLRDGALVSGIEEERLNRIKHWAGFPKEAVRTVLDSAGTTLGELAHVAVSRDPQAHLLEKVLFALRRRPGLEAIGSRLSNHRRITDLPALLSEAAGDGGSFRGTIHNVEHHRAHMASAFFCSPFDEAACLTVDGFGDFLSSMSGVGRGSKIRVLDEVMFPHSLGILYTAVTQFLGFPKYGDEYKVMGLAAFGEPRFLPRMRHIVNLTADGRFEADPDYFRHASEGVTMSWDGGEPVLGRLWSPKFVDAFGSARQSGEEITDRDRDLAASLQAIYEEAFFHRVNWLQKSTGLRALCLAGGCALNSVANGKLFGRTGFRDLFVQPAAGDAGTALGAALYVWHQVLGRPRGFQMEHSYWGPEFPEPRVRAAIEEKIPGLATAEGQLSRHDGLQMRRLADEGVLVRDTAAAIAGGRIVGWYQGRCEWGPRALGNRSILADPRRAEMKDVLNARIKRRESFRPFAPSILNERVGDYFEESYPDPFMVKVYPIRSARRREIPAVTHVDGTGRLQTVSQGENPLYWRLIDAFEKATGVPIVLNTSFNENEPIVNTPEEALECFLRTRMDRLVLGNWVIDRLGER